MNNLFLYIKKQSFFCISSGYLGDEKAIDTTIRNIFEKTKNALYIIEKLL